MIFTITYRDKSGGKASIEIEAENRSAVWAELKKRGIFAISVSEGKKPKTQKKNKVSPAIILACLATVFIGVVYFCFIASNDKVTSSNIKTRSDKKASVVKPKKSSQPPTVVKSAKQVCVTDKKDDSVHKPTMSSVTTNEEVVAETSGEASSTNTKRKVIFKNPMDQLMAMVMPNEPGEAVPPVPILEGAQFTPEQENQMFEQLTADEDDSEQVLKRKELVQAMRNEYVELKKRGWTFVDYIKALEAKAKLDNEVLTESWKIHETIFNDPKISDENYLETLNKINGILTERGIKPINPSSDDEE